MITLAHHTRRRLRSRCSALDPDIFRELARAAGVPFSAVAKVHDGYPTEPESVEAIARALDALEREEARDAA